MADLSNFEHAGLPCKVVQTSMGHLCGYVAIPKTHPWFGKSYNDPVAVPKETFERPIDIDKVGAINLFLAGSREQTAGSVDMVLAVDVHGGLTFSAAGKTDGMWWLGFDCAHCDDSSYPDSPNYRDQPYVEAECRALAEQLAKAA